MYPFEVYEQTNKPVEGQHLHVFFALLFWV